MHTASASGNAVLVSGLSTTVRLTSSTTADRLTLNGLDGNDQLTAAAGVEGLISTLFIGGAGDDTLTGGTGANTLLGDGSSNTFVALTDGNALLRFTAAGVTGTLTPVAVTGLQPGEVLQAIDVRPATGQLFGLGVTGGTTGRLYVINPDTGAATAVGSAPFSTALTGTAFGFDFNPTVDRIRVVTDTGVNLRLNPDTGAIAGTDTDLTAGSNVVGSAYDRNFGGATQTTLFGIDSTTDQLVRQGGVNGTPSPNGGAITAIGNLGVNTSDQVGFDIAAGTDAAFAVLQVGGVSGLFSINLSTGAATLIGNFAGGVTVRGLALLQASGNDLLQGGGGNDTLDGGLGDDVLAPGTALAAATQLSGGGGFDVVRVAGTAGVDVVSIAQAGNVLTTTVNGVAVTHTTTGVEQVQLDVAPGADAVTVANNLTVGVHTVAGAGSPETRFVEGVFGIFAGRLPRATEVQTGLTQLGSGTALSVVQSVSRSNESLTQLVKGFYTQFLGREAVGGEEQFFVGLIQSGQTTEQVQATILGSDEFFGRAQTLVATGTSDERYVTALFQQLLNRTPAAGEVAFWVGQLGSVSRTAVAQSFLTSAEFRTIQVTSFYSTILHRATPPSAAEVAFWVNSTADLLSIRELFAASAEFLANA